MRNTCFRVLRHIGKIMCGAGRDNRTEDMVEKLKADLARQIILSFEVAVKGAASDIGCIDDILNADFFIACFGKQFNKGIDNCLSGLFLSSVHSMQCSFPDNVQFMKSVH